MKERTHESPQRGKHAGENEEKISGTPDTSHHYLQYQEKKKNIL